MRKVAAGWLLVVAACGAPASTTTPPATSVPVTTTVPPGTTDAAPPTTGAAPTTSEPAAPEGGPTASVLSLLAQEPVVEPAAGEQYTNPGAVIEIDGVFHMFRNSFSQWPGDSQTHHLTSEDGVTWELDSEEPILTGEDVPFGDNNAFPMSVVVNGDEWVMFLYTYDGQSAPGFIGRATASGPEGPWVVDPNPVLTPGDDGAWDSLQVREPSVLKIGDEWLMYYTGSDQSSSAIGLASSEDGIEWSKQSEPVLTAQQAWWDSGSLGNPQVVRTETGFVMAYDASGRGAFGVGLATSDDGAQWTPWPANPIVAESSSPGGQQIWQYELVAVDGTLNLWLEVGPGSTRTDIYAYELSPAVISDPPPPQLFGEVEVNDDGNVVIRVSAIGLGIGFEAGNDEPRLVHPHIYVDREPPADGDDVPLDDPTIVHSVGSIILVRDLEPGTHVLWLVGADSTDAATVPPEPVRFEVTIEP